MKRIAYARKREGKTNYKKRLELLKSGKSRLVVRVTNKNLVLQLINYSPDGDKIISGVNTESLKNLGWKGSRKNIPAAYLGGLLLAKTSKIKEAILDLGLQKNKPKGKIYAAVKGVIEGGIKIACDEKVLPSEDQIKGTVLSKTMITQIPKIKEKILKK